MRKTSSGSLEEDEGGGWCLFLSLGGGRGLEGLRGVKKFVILFWRDLVFKLLFLVESFGRFLIGVGASFL